MPFDPTKPANGSDLDAAVVRDQLVALNDAIAASAGITGAVVDSVTTLTPSSPATATAQMTGTVLHLAFEIPAGVDGTTGPAGEVTQSQLSNDLVNCQNAAVNTVLPMTSANSNGVSIMGQIAAAAYDPAQFQLMLDKMDELINALRR